MVFNIIDSEKCGEATEFENIFIKLTQILY